MSIPKDNKKRTSDPQHVKEIMKEVGGGLGTVDYRKKK